MGALKEYLWIEDYKQQEISMEALEMIFQVLDSVIILKLTKVLHRNHLKKESLW